MLLKTDCVEVVHKEVSLLLSRNDFEILQRMRETSITTGNFAISGLDKEGKPVYEDRIAQAGEFLLPGGEVTGRELGVITGPYGPGSTILSKTFGGDWYKDW